MTALAEENTEFVFTVAGGWAVGSFVFTRANRISADRQALLAEIRVKYADGTEEVFGTGTDWQVSEGQVVWKPTCTTARFTTPPPI